MSVNSRTLWLSCWPSRIHETCRIPDGLAANIIGNDIGEKKSLER